MTFLDWFNDPDIAEERREIMRHLRCTEADAVVIQKLDALADRVEDLALAEFVAPDDDDPDDEEPMGI